MSDARRQPTTTKATLIIPALNEAQVIADLVRRTPREAVDEIIVVDNGSTDGTGQVAGAAGARVVAFLDGDGSQRPEELPRVIEPLVAGRADLVLGARSSSNAHPLHATFGTRLVAAFVARRYGLTITDIPPFRAIRVGLLKRLGMRDRAFGWPVEMIVKAAALQARIVEVPVLHEPRAAGRSKVSGTIAGSLRAGYGFLRAALRAAAEVR